MSQCKVFVLKEHKQSRHLTLFIVLTEAQTTIASHRITINGCPKVKLNVFSAVQVPSKFT